nr:GtrA family protein [Corynebacterium sp. c6VSa_13]
MTAFTAVGVGGAVVDYSTRLLCLGLGMPSSAARGVSYIAGSTFAYLANSVVTFSGQRSREEVRRAAISYLLCFLVAVGVDRVVLTVGDGCDHILVWSWVVSQAAATVLNFMLQRLWVFRAPK